MPPVNIAIVGLGFMAATHIKACRKLADVRVAAICNPSGRNLDGDFSKVFGNIGDQEPLKLDMSSVKAYRNFSELLADPQIDLIDLCTPTHTHHLLALEALRAGKHVLCEKPMARTSAQARELAEAATSAKVFFMPAMCLRFWPEYKWLRAALVSKAYGRVFAARFRRVAEPPAWGQAFFLNGALSGGALLDLHIHDVDFIQYCFGRPQSVRARGYSKVSGAIDHVVAEYDYPGGPMIHAEGAWAMTPGFGFNASFTVNFEHATADFDSARGAEALKVFEHGQPARIVTSTSEDGYTGEIAHLIDSIRANKAPTVVTAEDGVSAIELCEAEEQSIRTGERVPLRP